MLEGCLGWGYSQERVCVHFLESARCTFRSIFTLITGKAKVSKITCAKMEIAIYPNREPLHRLKLRIFHILALLASLLVCIVNIAQMESDNSYRCEFHTSMTT